MNSRGFTVCMLLALSSAALPLTAFAACDARSGPNTAALVELYTSEGCSSCPPADQQLSRLLFHSLDQEFIRIKLASALLSIGLLLAGGNALADDMKKDSMAKDSIKK